MKITQTAGTQHHHFSKVLVQPEKKAYVTWNGSEKTVVLTVKKIPDGEKGSHDFDVILSLAEVRKILETVCNAI
jgi:hypothetical protein